MTDKLILRDPWLTVGNTRLLKFSKNIYAKNELENPTGSIKDRIVQYIVKKAIEDGKITPETTLVEASSGNTAISLAAIGASLGLSVLIVMPSNMSEERKQMIRAFGAEIIDAPPSDFQHAIEIRNHLIEKSNCWSPMQFENELNIECHKFMIANELLKEMPIFLNNDKITIVSGAGTGGTIMGVRQRFREVKKNVFTVLVVPAEGAKCHGIQGINDGADFLINRKCIDHILKINTHDAIERAKKFAKQMGMLIGISGAANLLAAERIAENQKDSGIILTFFPDRGERYLSIYNEDK